MRDEESLTLWDHITGEAFEGKLAGQRMDWWSISLTNVKAALAKHPNIILLVSNYRSPKASLLKWMHKDMVNGAGWIPGHFSKTMSSEVDPRLDKLAQGLGVIVDDVGKHYPLDAIPKGGHITDSWDGKPLIITRGKLDGVPFAEWADDPNPPMQLLTRWYGFSFTYPDCEIFGLK